MLHGLARRSEWVVGHEVLRDMQGSGVKMTDWLENAAEEVARGYIAFTLRCSFSKKERSTQADANVACIGPVTPTSSQPFAQEGEKYDGDNLCQLL